MKTYLSDHARLVKLENEIKELARDLREYIKSSTFETVPVIQTIGNIVTSSPVKAKPLYAVALRKTGITV